MMSPIDYRQALLKLMDVDEIDDPALSMIIKELEDACLALNFKLPIANLPEHFYYKREWFFDVGLQEMCKCSAAWPCPLGVTDGN